jgi:hypothetical protein
MLVACSGGGGSGGSLPKTPPITPAKTLKATVRVTVPGSASTSNVRLRRIYSAASNTQGIQVVAYPTGNRTTPLATSVADIAPASANCTAGVSGSRSCTFSITAPIGDDDFVFNTYDGWTGTTVSGNILGAGVTTQTIATGSSPTIGVTLNGVLASVQLALVPGAIHSIVPSNTTLDVYALDADNDVIVSNAFYDAAGDPVTVTIAPSPGPTPLNNSLSLSTTSLTAPAANGIGLTYNGDADDAGSPVTFSASSSPAGVTSNMASLSVVYPSFSSGGNLADSNLSATGAFHGGAVFTSGTTTPLFLYDAQTQNIDYYDYSSPGITTTTGNPATGYYGGMFLVNGTSKLYLAAQSGLYSEPVGSLGTLALTCVPSCPPSNGSGLGYDPTLNDMYYTSGTNLVQVNASTGATATANIGVVANGGVAVDSNSNVWVVQTGSNASLLEITNFATPSINTVTLSSNSQPFDVITAGNGDIVVSDKFDTALWVFNSGGGYVGNYYVPCSPCGVPWYLAADPAQPNVVWFDFATYGSEIGVGRLDISTGQITAEAYNSGPNNGQPGALAVSNAGGIVMVFDGAGTLVQVQP